MNEQEMIKRAETFFLNSGKYENVLLEVPLGSRSIDMVLIDKEQKISTIEFKLSNWKHAIAHARDHALGADYAYICLPVKAWPGELKIVAKQQGIGVLLFYPATGRVEPYVDPVPGAQWIRMRESLQLGINWRLAQESQYQKAQELKKA